MFEPKIVTFLCTWCSYTGADLAGTARLNTPCCIRAVRVPCSGRVSPELVMRAFDEGADGVLVLGCHIGECHYDTGNHRTAKRLPILQALLSFTGLEPERLRLDWVSASESERYCRIVNEFSTKIQELGPARWKVGHAAAGFPAQAEILRYVQPLPPASHHSQISAQIRAAAKDLLTSGQVSTVIGYEVGPRGRTRPVFVRSPEQVEKLVWNQDCTHNLSVYLRELLSPRQAPKAEQPPARVALVAKPCDTRSLNVLLGEERFGRQQVHVIAVPCDGIRAGAGKDSPNGHDHLQERCQQCEQRQPVLSDTWIEVDTPPPEPVAIEPQALAGSLRAPADLDSRPPAERLAYWVSQFDRCIRCYACRQACPVCDCPTCLYERDDSLWTGMQIEVDQKRAFHLGRAFHLAGRCVGCDECQRACPMDIPIRLLNQKLAEELHQAFGFQAGLAPVPSPITTVLGEERAA